METTKIFVLSDQYCSLACYFLNCNESDRITPNRLLVFIIELSQIHFSTNSFTLPDKDNDCVFGVTDPHLLIRLTKGVKDTILHFNVGALGSLHVEFKCYIAYLE